MQAQANALLEIHQTPKTKSKVAKNGTSDKGEFLSYLKAEPKKEPINNANQPQKSAHKQSQNNQKNENSSPNATQDVKKPQSPNKSEKISQDNDVKGDIKSQENTPKSPAQQKVDELKQASDNAINRLEQSITKEGASTMLDDANLMQLLAVLDAINAPKDEQSGLFPKLGEKLASLLEIPENAKALSEAKSVADVINLAKKFDLELKDIKITNEIEQALADKFPNLAAKDFFKSPGQALLKTGEFLTKTKVDEGLKQTKNESTTLASLLGEVSQADEDTVVIEPLKDKVAKDDVKAKDVSLKGDSALNQESKAPSLRDLIFPERAATGSSKNSELGLNSSSLGSQNISLEPLNVGDEPKSDLGLNSAAKNIIAEAKIQLQNRAAVRETLGNFSSNLAEQVANYKAPITKVSMTLNPLNLGEVEVVMTTRGNNLHINFTSNTQAMNLFIANQAEFKNSLVNMGFTELSMNFSDQNQRQNQQNGHSPKGRSFFAENEEVSEQEQISLELILPRYI